MKKLLAVLFLLFLSTATYANEAELACRVGYTVFRNCYSASIGRTADGCYRLANEIMQPLRYNIYYGALWNICYASCLWRARGMPFLQFYEYRRLICRLP